MLNNTTRTQSNMLNNTNIDIKSPKSQQNKSSINHIEQYHQDSFEANIYIYIYIYHQDSLNYYVEQYNHRHKKSSLGLNLSSYNNNNNNNNKLNCCNVGGPKSQSSFILSSSFFFSFFNPGLFQTLFYLRYLLSLSMVYGRR